VELGALIASLPEIADQWSTERDTWAPALFVAPEISKVGLEFPGFRWIGVLCLIGRVRRTRQ
jgi:hypothetical protein